MTELRSNCNVESAGQDLNGSEEFYRKVVQNTSAVILRLDPKGIIRFANERALEFFGYSADELIGKHVVYWSTVRLDT